ncbi:Lipopolysaccharide choline phosphotransferase protein [Fasciola gigantica]|uniref:Lipopolysaccharide choline phosphotransferase protein n=1 Tax=Fasciola gigantica TaxID=46835 RepID=A0A504Z5G9_FASGI|nr:Lipopolysaccharide choline phosphotransferase protein [Fasciola gigantica]
MSDPLYRSITEDLLSKKSRYLTLFKLIIVFSGFIILGLWIRQCMQPKFSQPICPKCEKPTSSHELIDMFLVKRFMNQTPWDRLPNLSRIRWPESTLAALPAGRLLSRKNKMRAPNPPLFEPILSRGQRRLYDKLLLRFAELMDRHGYTNRYFLSSGTLIGSYRHHDFIPWDEDVDITADVKLRPWIQKALSNMQPEYSFAKAHRDKLFTKLLPLDQDNETDVEQSRQSTGVSWGWPFLDITYFDANETHVFEVLPSLNPYDSWPKDVVFPLLYRPFGQHWFPAPRNSLQSLIYSYGRTDECKTQGYSHIFERSIASNLTKCRLLGSRYAFVQRHPCLVNGQLVHSGGNMLVEERLVRQLPNDSVEIIHSLCLASDVTNVRAETYALDLIK